MNTDLTKKCKKTFIEAIQEKLDTRDKRWMFLKLTFPDRIPYIQLEGCPIDVAYNIYEDFEKNNMLGSLMAHFNGQLGCDLFLEMKGYAK